MARHIGDYDYDYEFKVFVVGESEVGKSNLILQGRGNAFQQEYVETRGKQLSFIFHLDKEFLA